MRAPANLSVGKGGKVTGETTLSPKGYGSGVAVPIDARPYLPVILVPGIMASNLRVASRARRMVYDRLAQQRERATEIAWRPPNAGHYLQGAGAIKDAAFTKSKYSPAVRQILLDPATTEVDPGGPTYWDPRGLVGRVEAQARGWGTVLWDAYGPFMCELNHALQRTLPPAKSSWWTSEGLNPLWQKLREGQGPYAPFRLTEAELKKVQQYQMPVHACGYNWLHSNGQSAEDLKQEVDRILAHYRERGAVVGKVLLVSHSMGGLVVRAFARKYPGLVMGVVHGVQPAVGAAACYYRMVAGMEFDVMVATDLLGRTGRETIPVMGNAPGPLELLPTKDYGMGWLHLEEQRPDGSHRTLLSLPQRDPYEEIYKQQDSWARLADPERLDPANLNKKADATPWGAYLKALGKAQQFHQELGTYYFPERTHAFYGDNACLQTISHVRWRCVSKDGRLDATGLERLKVYWDDAKGERSTDVERPSRTHPGRTERVRVPLYLATRGEALDGSGDGTVPRVSGSAPGRAGVKHTYRLELWKDVDPKHPEKSTAHDHQDAFNNEQARAVTLYALAKILQEAP